MQSRDHFRTDSRLMELTRWLAERPESGFGHELALEPASADASFRRYFRVRAGALSRIVMDAPPPREDVRPWLDIAARLRAQGLPAPEVHAADPDRGFVLLEDFGVHTLLARIQTREAQAGTASRHVADATTRDDYRTALALLHPLQAISSDGLPEYDETLLQRELDLFPAWLLERHLGLALKPETEAAWRQTCKDLIQHARAQEQVFVHRDFHLRNLMARDDGGPPLGIIDFQDAVRGPISYDALSLLRDAYRRLPEAEVYALLSEWHAQAARTGRTALDWPAFRRAFDLMGVQRHLKVAGIFARLYRRDGKPGYLADIPRVLGYLLDIAPRYAVTSWLADWLDRLDLERRLAQVELPPAAAAS